MLCLAPIELVTEAERRLHRALSGLGPGTGVLGGLVVFVPVVDGAMQRRQAEAVAFLPESVVVVRAVGMGRQTGELRPSATGMWTVGGEILRLSGGGASPAGPLRKAVELIVAALSAGGIDPGAPAALAAIDGLITSVRDRSAGGPVACSMDAGDVLTGLRHCANVGSQGDTRVWTTADVKAALAIFGLQSRGPSVEELNNEGFLYSPYVLRRAQSAVGARTDAAPAVSLLSGPFAPVGRSAPATPPLPAEALVPPAPTGPMPAPGSAAAPGPPVFSPLSAWDDSDLPEAAPAATQLEAPPTTTAPRAKAPEPVWADSPVPEAPSDARSDDSGVGGLFAEPATSPSTQIPSQPPPPVSDPASGRSSRAAVLLGVAVLLVLAAVAGLVYALSSGLGGNDPAGSDEQAGATSVSTPPAASTEADPTERPTQEIAGSTYTLEAARNDADCAANAYGQVAEFFVTTPCDGLTRALFTATVDEAPAVVSVSVVTMPDETSAAALQVLADTSGTGNVSDLLRAGVQIDGGPSELVAAAYDSELSGTQVRIVEVAWVDAATDGDEARLEAAAADALLLEVPEA